jgi:hypothetical protein
MSVLSKQVYRQQSLQHKLAAATTLIFSNGMMFRGHEGNGKGRVSGRQLKLRTNPAKWVS